MASNNCYRRIIRLMILTTSLSYLKILVFPEPVHAAYLTTCRGSKLERQADKMREIIAMLGWLTPLYAIFGLCFMSVCLMKSNCYSLIYSSLGLGYVRLQFPLSVTHRQKNVRRLGQVILPIKCYTRTELLEQVSLGYIQNMKDIIVF